MPLVPNNAMVDDIQEIGNIPVKPGRNVYIARRGHDRRRHRRQLTATPWWTAASRSTCRSSRKTPPRRCRWWPTSTRRCRSSRACLPEDVDISFEFDESPTVVDGHHAAWPRKGLIGATLTGLMILLFLRDWRSVIVVVFNIPMALLGSLLGLWMTGNTINIMTLGGLALAIGILVDEATVELENIHAQMDTDARRWPGRCVRRQSRPRCRGCWPCCASCRCSSPPSSWPSRCGRCSCRCRWRSASP